jgi:Ca2+-binding RTX toxin-like protein
LTSALDITGTTGTNAIATRAGADTIDGLGGADAIDAGAGNDIVSYYGSETSISGGASGVDTLVLKTAVTVNLSTIADRTSGDSVTVTNFTNVDGSGLGANLSLTGTTGANSLKGGSGNDTVDGKAGLDVINAGSGDDTVLYYGVESSIAGGAGTGDVLKLAATAPVVTVNLGAVGDQTSGDAVLVTGFEGVDASLTTAAVAFNGTTSADVIRTGSGADTIDGLGGADVIDAGAGNDVVSYYGAEASVSGGSAGNDTLVMKAAATVDLSNAADQTSGDTTVVTNIQNVDGSALVVGFSLTGSGLDNRLTGGSGADTIDGGSGADTIDGKGGADSLSGGAGNDIVNYYGSEAALSGGASGVDTLALKAAVTLDLANADQTTGDATVVTNFQNVDGSALAAGFSATGSGLDNALTGGSGADTIDGAGGADTIDGKGGADSITGGAGDDYVYYYGAEAAVGGGLGVDTLNFTAATPALTLNLSSADQTTGDTVAVSGFEIIDASAMTAAVTFSGTAGADVVTTGSGADSIDGLGGADVIDAGAGNDTVAYNGGETSISGGSAGVDMLVLRTAATVNLANTPDQTTGDAVTVTKFQSVDGSGLGVNLSLTGASNANTLKTGSGADVIDGGGGADVIDAGAGNDTV